ncbi:AEC family transporter [Herbiconiux sp. CPCC 205763]|uniref:AEC family transporter n=1 Tax=Herbiconiux aconitum TaxID=2970913 RepID=A0ABT2GVH0_9MICO|nr:AEC family transporter [Herbiconiux aconitum]MCS5720188.1 AEC family transporter [Herbiconiux aconitum]
MPLEIATALLPVFFVMALGFAAGKTRLVDNQNVRSLNTIVMSIALPISLFVVLSSASRADVVAHWPLAAISLFVMAAGYGATYLLSRRTARQDAGDSAVQALTVSFPNAAAVGIPLAGSVLGPTGMLGVATVLAVGSITMSPLTVAVLEIRKSASAAGPRSRTILRAIGASLRKPIVIGPVLGLVWSLAGLPLPPLVNATLSEIGAVTAGLALFLTGLVISAQPIRFSTVAVISTLIAVVGRPALAVAIVLAVGLTGPLAQETVLLLALPAGFVGLLLGLRYGSKPPAAGATVLFSSVLSVVTLPIVIAFLPAF